MILPKNIKIAFFDFDDTLAIHRDKFYVERRAKYGENEYFKNAYLYPNRFYDDIAACYVPEETLNLVAWLNAKDVKLYCLTGMRMSLHISAKEAFLKKHYGAFNFELVAAKDQQTKLDVIKILREIHDCGYNEILFVDDVQDNLDIATDLGIIVLNAKDIRSLCVAEGRTLYEAMDD